MAELRFASAPRRKGPNKALLATGLVVLLAAAFGVGRLWTRPAPAPESLPVPASAAPASPAEAAAAPPPKPAPALTSTPSRILMNNEVFEIPRTAPPAAPQAAAATAFPETPKPDTLARQIGRCLTFTVARDNMFTVTSGVRLQIRAQNHCGQTFPGSEAKFEIRAMAAGGTGMAGRERGIFQTSIPPFGSAETVIVVPCDPDGVYRFEVEVM